MNSKRGAVLGESLSMIVAIVAIALILTVFVFGSGIIRTFSKTESGVKVYDESQVGLSTVSGYILYSYPKLLIAKSKISQGYSVKDSFEEADNYEQ
jgi:hypothetical protein